MCGCGGFLKSRAPLRDFILGTLLSVILQLKVNQFNSENPTRKIQCAIKMCVLFFVQVFSVLVMFE